jgi:hypothetical protein
MLLSNGFAIFRSNPDVAWHRYSLRGRPPKTPAAFACDGRDVECNADAPDTRLRNLLVRARSLHVFAAWRCAESVGHNLPRLHLLGCGADYGKLAADSLVREFNAASAADASV